MRRGDESIIPEAQRVAQTFRAEVFEPLKNDAVARGLLPEDVSVDTALSYFTRVYDREKIKAFRPEFEA
ncbi:MAG: hypothetical protein GWM92_04265, partial [Gemmatimonadetes bacterium]|nr:hypothetical protein [Gemmatimonadota bacterium]NIR77775.1 hypothetical protein [Gemmatimonadota bacterium]NIT86311.1 hypothetical protein [Gemmatimonadota bacterium]NIU30145.1 hypothetical protein [Gemmatimonadota bacterium]NIU35085.1 hypothetical protein [Gemmatimonadota bacterium]